MFMIHRLEGYHAAVDMVLMEKGSSSVLEMHLTCQVFLYGCSLEERVTGACDKPFVRMTGQETRK
jgi:hypothetical protein